MEKIIYSRGLCNTSMLQTDGGLVRKTEKNGEFWNLPDGSLGKCRLDGSWFIVGAKNGSGGVSGTPYVQIWT